MILMIAPGPNQTFTASPSGAVYKSDANSLIKITSDSAADQASLLATGCFTASPFGGWGNFGFTSLANLYAADQGALLPFMTGFPQNTVATIFSDPTPANCGTWTKTGNGNGSGQWVQVSTQTLASISGAVAAAQASATASATAAAASATGAAASATSASASAATATSQAASATSSASSASTSAATATAAAEASGGYTYPTYAAASTAAAGLPNNTAVRVLSDSNHSNDYTGYYVQSGALVFVIDFSHPSAAILTWMAQQMIALGLVLAP